jgi:hypothetical protein
MFQATQSFGHFIAIHNIMKPLTFSTNWGISLQKILLFIAKVSNIGAFASRALQVKWDTAKELEEVNRNNCSGKV